MEGCQGTHVEGCPPQYGVPPAQQPGLAAPVSGLKSRKRQWEAGTGGTLKGSEVSQVASVEAEDEASWGKDRNGTQMKVLRDRPLQRSQRWNCPKQPNLTAHPPATSSDHKSAKPKLIYFLKAEFPQILLWHHLDTVFKILFPLKQHQSAFLLKCASLISSPEVKQHSQGTHRAMWQIVWKLGTKK